MELIHKEVRLIRTGPYFYYRNRAVFRVVLQKNGMKTYKAWAVVGSLNLVDAENIEVLFDASSNAHREDRYTLINTLMIFLYLVMFAIVSISILLLLLGVDLKSLVESWFL